MSYQRRIRLDKIVNKLNALVDLISSVAGTVDVAVRSGVETICLGWFWKGCLIRHLWRKFSLLKFMART